MTVIRVENVGKKYIIGQNGSGSDGLRHALNDFFTNPIRRFQAKTKPSDGNGMLTSDLRPLTSDFWALKDISFEVKQGEVVGIIGRNGAGKSTLLKILSRITEPTTGRLGIRGRVASLLEVGTGFHPELTGRENVFLNGAILGMTREEIKRKFDEIVAFAEVEKFLDTPVKRYSSGMYVRLAFAVAAHLEPEILIIDEVLAVGDAEFQKKCLGKMDDVAKEGRTVLFVSHNMAAVTRLCQRGILLDKGRVVRDSDIFDATNKYAQSNFGISGERQWRDLNTAPGDGVAKLKAVRVISNGAVTDRVDIRQPVTVEMEYWNFKPGASLIEVFTFMNEEGLVAFISADFQRDDEVKAKPAGLFRVRCRIPGNLLAEGQFRVAAEVSTSEPYEKHFLEFDSVGFQVVDLGEPGSVRAGWVRHIPGVLRPKLEWQAEYLGTENHEDGLQLVKTI